MSIDVDTTLPHIDGSVVVDASFEEMLLTVKSWCGEHTFQIARRCGRWRIPNGGLFVSKHRIAANVFSYQKNPSRNEMDFMGDYIETIGEILDSAHKTILDGVEQRWKERQEERQKPRQFCIDEIKTECDPQPIFVYLMKHANGLTKIGYSKNPRQREKTLQAEDPRLQLIFKCEADRSIETRLHQIFSETRVRGEWFNLAKRHIDWVVSLLGRSNAAETSESCDGCENCQRMDCDSMLDFDEVEQ